VTSYEGFARIYDVFMADAPYAPWLKLLRDTYPLGEMDITDVGCGTGMLTVPLAALSRTVTGVDVSEEMLAKAQERAMAAHSRVTWLCQDMRHLRLPAPMDLIISTCDVVNYLNSHVDLKSAFSRIFEALKPGGRFAFDAIGPRRLAALAEGYWHQIEDVAVMLHETRVEDHRIEHDIHAFVMDEDGLYERIEERHRQMYFSATVLVECLEECGFQVTHQLADFEAGRLEHADRLVFIANK
jgi:SAM-dependent methyltransferase